MMKLSAEFRLTRSHRPRTFCDVPKLAHVWRNTMATTGISSPLSTDTNKTSLWSNMIFQKLLMAVSGVILVLFVVGHLVGNLQIFLGPDKLNAYAETLKQLGALVWVIRAVLAILVILHIETAVKLYFYNKKSRPVGYEFDNTATATVASRTMIWSGLAIAFFVGYHLAHYTLMSIHPEWSELRDADGRHDVYSMVIYGFRNFFVSGLYFVAMFLLSIHLSHGIASMFQTLGFAGPGFTARAKLIGSVLAWLIFVGYVSIPFAILTGMIGLPSEGM
jgi:succinate dehydrogenase / fumarate reductase, cytochrome b subunit